MNHIDPYNDVDEINNNWMPDDDYRKKGKGGGCMMPVFGVLIAVVLIIALSLAVLL